MWPFSKASKKEEARALKMMAGQKALLEAATATADIAENVTKKLQNYLIDTIKQFEATMRILTDALVVCDEKGMVQAFNPSAETIFGYDSGSIIKTNIMDLMLIENAKPDPLTFWQLTENDSDNITGVRANGEHFPLDLRMVRLVRSDKSVIFLVLIRDLTKETELQRKTDIHEYRYNSVLNFVSDGIIIVQDNKIVAANSSAGKLFEKNPDSLLNSRFDGLVDLEHRNAVQSIDHETGEIEAISTRNDGSILNLIFSSTSFSWNDLPASLITIKDISNLKSLENAVRNHIPNCIDMIVCLSPDYKITFANEAFCCYHNIPKDQLIGLEIKEILSDGECNVVMLNLQNLSEAAPERRLQVNTKTKNGIRMQDWLDRAAFRDGKVVEYQRIGRDITDLFKT